MIPKVARLLCFFPPNVANMQGMAMNFSNNSGTVMGCMS